MVHFGFFPKLPLAKETMEVLANQVFCGMWFRIEHPTSQFSSGQIFVKCHSFPRFPPSIDGQTEQLNQEPETGLD